MVRGCGGRWKCDQADRRKQCERRRVGRERRLRPDGARRLRRRAVADEALQLAARVPASPRCRHARRVQRRASPASPRRSGRAGSSARGGRLRRRPARSSARAGRRAGGSPASSRTQRRCPGLHRRGLAVGQHDDDAGARVRVEVAGAGDLLQRVVRGGTCGASSAAAGSRSTRLAARRARSPPCRRPGTDPAARDRSAATPPRRPGSTRAA